MIKITERPKLLVIDTTNSSLTDSPGKRARLITGVQDTIYRQGAEVATIAEIAEAAGVPAGNLDYYFESKDELVTPELLVREGRRLEPWLDPLARDPKVATGD